MATESNSVGIANCFLTKVDAAPPASKRSTTEDKMSNITSSTTKSKAHHYANSAVKEVSLQNYNTINDLHDDIEEAALTLPAKYV